MLATGKALALFAAVLERGGVATTAEVGDLLGVFAVTVAADDPDEGDILAVWASIIKEAGEGRDPQPNQTSKI